MQQMRLARQSRPEHEHVGTILTATITQSSALYFSSCLHLAKSLMLMVAEASDPKTIVEIMGNFSKSPEKTGLRRIDW